MQLVDALVCSEPGRLQIVQRPIPRPDPGHALVRPRRVGICGTDYHIFEGKHPFLTYPRVMGHELAVEVVEAPVASGLSPGEVCVVNPYLSCGRCIACLAGKPNCCVNISVLGVHQDGGLVGQLSVPAGNLIRAQGLTADECAAVEFLSIGAHAVRRAAVTSRDRVLVVGAGPIGLGVALFAGLAGGDITLVDIDHRRLDFATQSGIVARAIPADDRTDERVTEATNGEGFDVVFDATGNRGSMQEAVRHVAHGGSLALVSVVNENITFSDPELHKRELTVLGSRNAVRADFERVMAAIEERRVPLQRLLTHRTSLARAAADIPRWTTDKKGLLKALVEIE